MASIQKTQSAGIPANVIKAVWIMTVLVWPIVRWIIGIEVGLQFFRMLWYWHTPGVHAGWTFLLHFGVLTALTYFVGAYKPKGI